MLWKVARFERKRTVIKKKNNKRKKCVLAYSYPQQLDLFEDSINSDNNDYKQFYSKNNDIKTVNNLATTIEKRYYTILLEKDLLNEWQVARINGRINTRLGKIRNEIYPSLEEGLNQFNKLYRYREKREHYQEVSSYSYLPELNSFDATGNE